MAAHLSVSLSESVQASLIIQHQEERKLLEQKPHCNAKASNSTPSQTGLLHSPVGFPLSVQCLMVMVFASIEMCCNFTLIYSILFVKFLGVPTSLLTVEGIIGGGVSIIFLPITGYFADRGPDLVIRKMKMMLISLAMYTLGFSGVAICSALRLNVINTPIGNLTTIQNMTGPTVLPDLTHQTTDIHNITASLYHTPTSQHIFTPLYSLDINSTQDRREMYNTTIGQHGEISETPIGAIQVFGIISTGLLDAGFDTGMSLCRAYILEVSPPSIHNQLLIMATAFSAFGGLVLSSFGIIDFPKILGEAFDVDGTAANILMLSCSILSFIIIGFVCTAVTGYVVYRRSKFISEERGDNKCDSRSDLHKNDRSRILYKRGLSMRGSKTPTPVIGTTGDVHSQTEPLLSTTNDIDNKSYSALSTTSIGEIEERLNHQYKNDGFDKNQYQKIRPIWERNASHVIYEDKPYEDPRLSEGILSEDVEKSVDGAGDDNDGDGHEEGHQVTNSQSGDDEDDEDDEDDNKNSDNDESNFDHQQQEGGGSEISNIYAAMRASYSMSLSILQSSIRADAHARKSPSSDKLISENNTAAPEEPSLWKCKRLRLLLFAIFFTMGANLSFTTFGGIALNFGVYHGDPTAPEGTTERANYNKGLRSGALGTLVLYVGFSIVCLLNKRIIDVIGEKSYFVACQVGYVLTFTAFVLVKTEVLYFVLSSMSGLYRGCAFTLGYIMVNKLVMELTSKNGEKSAKNIGKVMALIGFLLPSKFVILSVMIGPLMAALDNVWLPIIMGGVESSLALLVFILFLFAKN